MEKNYYQFDIWYSHAISQKEKLNHSLLLAGDYDLIPESPYFEKGMTELHDTLYFSLEGDLDINVKPFGKKTLCEALNSVPGVVEWKFRKTTKDNLNKRVRLETSLESPNDWQ